MSNPPLARRAPISTGIPGLDEVLGGGFTPDRLYLIGVDGRVAYKSKPGPFGFKPDALEAALREALKSSSPVVP